MHAARPAEGDGMRILAIESSCDETAAAVSENGRTILSNVVLSQADMHAVFGGVVPEIASRRHIEGIVGVVDEALKKAGVTADELDAVAVTYAPGLIGALLVGVNFAKAFALARGLPLVPVHHMRGHIAANYIAFPALEPPFCCLVVSGGHSLIVDVEDYTVMRILGTTRDDAAGEAFDKAARVLGLPYPGGLEMDRLAKTGDPTSYRLPRASVDGAPLDFSFSGLKTAVRNAAHNAAQRGETLDRAGLAASFCQAVADTLVPRAVEGAKHCGRRKLCAAGGVAANSVLRARLQRETQAAGLELYLPPLSLCGDNGAMIAAQAYYEFRAGTRAGADLNARATLPVSVSYEG